MAGSEGRPDGWLVERLTRREREVLGLLAQGYSAPEIAEKLTLAVSSVKSHIRHVYGKLGVSGKRQALTRAKELGLLGAPFTAPALAPQPSTPPAATAWCLAGLAGAAAVNEEPERAAFLWGAAEARRQSIGAREAPASHATYERPMAAAREQLGEAAFAAAWAEGQAITMEQAVAEATRDR